MSANTQETQTSEQTNEQQKKDKEYNFAQMRQQLERERLQNQALVEELEQTKRAVRERSEMAAQSEPDEDADDGEPYVEPKKLNRKLQKLEKKMEQQMGEQAHKRAAELLAEYKEQMWMEQNPDFYDVMQHAQHFADKAPALAKTILNMPEGFERKKLVYENIKTLGIHKPPETKASIQDQIDSNRKHLFYQPSGMAAPAPGAPPVGRAVTPEQGQAAYNKMKELKARLTL